MKKTILLFLLSLCIFPLSGCGGGAGGTTATISDIGNVEGVITTASGVPIPGANILIGNQNATSGQTGLYSMTNLAIGTRTVIVTMAGYQNYMGTVLVLKGTTVPFNIQLIPTFTGNTTGSVSGAITSFSGTPLAGAAIFVDSNSTTSGSTGSFAISNLTSGSHSVTASLNGYLSYSGMVTVQQGVTTQFNISLTPIPTTAILKLALSGILPSNTAIAGAGLTMTLPANTTPTLANGSIASGVVVNSGIFVSSSIQPQIIYTPATVSTLGTIHITLASSNLFGLSQVGEAATITLQLSNGASPSVSSFAINGDNIYDATLTAISGMSVKIVNVTLQ